MFRTWKGFALVLAATAAVALIAPWGSPARPQTVYGATEQITLNVDSDPEGGVGFEFTVTTKPDECTFSADELAFALDDDGHQEIDCGGTPTGGIFVITIEPLPAWVYDTAGTTCNIDPDDGLFEASGNTLTINIEDNIHVSCTVSFLPSGTPTVTPTSTTTPGPAPTSPVLGFPTSECSGFPFPSSANVTFTWTGPANVSAIYLDLSVTDNNFADGTYATQVLPSGTTSVTWNGLQAGVPYFWRVTGQGLNDQWVQSAFGRFVPCGRQTLLNIHYSCTGGGRATVEFRWAPASSPGFFQFLDISLFNNNFAPNTFLGVGPMVPNAQGVIWPGILANTVHFFRVNTFSIFGWGPSATGSFVAAC